MPRTKACWSVVDLAHDDGGGGTSTSQPDRNKKEKKECQVSVAKEIFQREEKPFIIVITSEGAKDPSDNLRQRLGLESSQ